MLVIGTSFARVVERLDECTVFLRVFSCLHPCRHSLEQDIPHHWLELVHDSVVALARLTGIVVILLFLR